MQQESPLAFMVGWFGVVGYYLVLKGELALPCGSLVIVDLFCAADI